jgi:hypothetical protein
MEGNSPFGMFALVFIPVLCLLLIYILARGWLEVEWL